MVEKTTRRVLRLGWRAVLATGLGAALLPAVRANAEIIQYSLMLGSPLNDQNFRNSMHADYYTIVHTKKFSKFSYLVIPAPSCSNFMFPEFVKLANKLAAANTSGMKLVYYSRPAGSDGWESFSLQSPGCGAYGSTPSAFYASLLGATGFSIPAVDLESLHFPSGVDVGSGILNYLQTLAPIYQSTQPLWVANTAYPEKFATTTGAFFTFNGSGQITGNSTLPSSLVSELGQVIWMDFHTMYAEINPSPRAFIDQRLQQVAAISGAKTSIQIGLTCLNGEVSLQHVSDQQVMSTSVAEGETVMIDAVNLVGIRNFNVYTTLMNLKSPQWTSFYKLMNTNSAGFPTQPNVAFKPVNTTGTSYGYACLQE